MQPGQQKISQFDPITSTQSGDIIPIVRNGQNKRITIDNFSGTIPDGFISAAQVWTFSSFNSASNTGVITVPSDATTRYYQGMFVRITQTTGGTKYGVILAVTTTTITVWFGVGLYTLVNEAISAPFYSSLAHPAGAPIQITEGMPYAFSVYRNASGGTVGNGSFGVVPYDTKEYDNTNGYSTAAATYTAPVAGIYYFDVAVQYASVPSNTILITSILVNSTSAETKRLDEVIIGGGNITRRGSCQLKLAAGDIVRVGARGSGNAIGTNSAITTFAGHLLSR